MTIPFLSFFHLIRQLKTELDWDNKEKLSIYFSQESDFEKFYFGLISFYCFGLKYYDDHSLNCSLKISEEGARIYFTCPEKDRFFCLNQENKRYGETFDNIEYFKQIFQQVYQLSTENNGYHLALLKKLCHGLVFLEKGEAPQAAILFQYLAEILNQMDLLKLMLSAKRALIDLGCVSKISLTYVEVFFPIKELETQRAFSELR